MGEKISDWEHLTTGIEAKSAWKNVLSLIKEAGREDVLQNLTVLDLGGGAGEFSKNLNAQGIKCISLDAQDLETNPGANQIRGIAYRMPFADNSFGLVYERSALDDKVYKPEFTRLFTEITRVLKQDGVLFICELQPPKKELEKYFKLLASEGEEFYTLWGKK